MYVNSVNKLPREFYERDDVTGIARELLGKEIYTRVGGELTRSRIVETEAYRGADDRACHAYLHKMTARTRIMFGPGGFAYVYLCYGVHHLFNIVTNREGMADAVLIRGVEPLGGLKVMQKRRKTGTKSQQLTSGPGKLSQALGITTRHYGEDLLKDTIWVTESENRLSQQIISTTRIGVEYAGEDAKRPWRFYYAGNRFVSKY